MRGARRRSLPSPRARKGSGGPWRPAGSQLGGGAQVSKPRLSLCHRAPGPFGLAQKCHLMGSGRARGDLRESFLPCAGWSRSDPTFTLEPKVRSDFFAASSTQAPTPLFLCPLPGRMSPLRKIPKFFPNCDAMSPRKPDPLDLAQELRRLKVCPESS